MKVSELKDVLENVLLKDGDLDVVVFNPYKDRVDDVSDVFISDEEIGDCLSRRVMCIDYDAKAIL